VKNVSDEVIRHLLA